jgi:hypothetical protein
VAAAAAGKAVAATAPAATRAAPVVRTIVRRRLRMVGNIVCSLSAMKG